MTADAAAIRTAVPADFPALIAAYHWLMAPPGSVPRSWDETSAADALAVIHAVEDAEVYVAEIGGEIVGFCTVYLDIRSVRFGQRAWIEDLAVHPERRSSGIGKQLLGTALGWARERGASHLELDSAFARTDAHRFYEREQPSWKAMSFGWEL